jgi:tetrahydromethanopterin S-methyltransferase subunit B
MANIWTQQDIDDVKTAIMELVTGRKKVVTVGSRSITYTEAEIDDLYKLLERMIEDVDPSKAPKRRTYAKIPGRFNIG